MGFDGKQMRDNTLAGSKIKDAGSGDGVTVSKIEDDAIETSKIKNGNVNAAKLGTDAVEEAKIKDLNVTTGKLAANAVTPGKADLTAAWAFPQSKLQSIADPVNPNDVPRKSYVDGLVNGVSWKDPCAVLELVGNAAVATINGLGAPIEGDAYVLTDGGSLTAGTPLVVTIGDLVEFDGTSWVMIFQAVGGFVPAGTRAILSMQTPLISPYVDATDDGKIVDFTGASNTGLDTAEAIDGNAVLINADASVFANNQYAYDGTVPTGSWVQMGGLGQVTARDGLTKTGNILDVTAVAAGGLEIAGGAGSGGDVQIKADGTGGANIAESANLSANGLGIKVDDASVDADGSGQLKAAVPTLSDKYENQFTYTEEEVGPPNIYKTNIALTSTPARDSYVQVFVNGLRASVADGPGEKATRDCYFADSGTPGTAKSLASLVAGDILMWNKTWSGFDLDNSAPPSGDILALDYAVL